jgi:hypothetical protein
MYNISSDFLIASKSFHVTTSKRQQILPKLYITSQEVVFKVLFSAVNFYSSKLWERGWEGEEAR